MCTAYVLKVYLLNITNMVAPLETMNRFCAVPVIDKFVGKTSDDIKLWPLRIMADI